MNSKSVKMSVVSVTVILLCAAVAFGGPVGPTIYGRVTTDKSSYLVGETVHWNIYVWGNTGETHGMAFIDCNLIVDNGTGGSLEILQPALTAGLGGNKHLLDTLYSSDNNYTLDGNGAGTPGPGGVVPAGVLADIHVRQLDNISVLDIGNDGLNTDLLGKGQFVAQHEGTYTVRIEIGAANYWQLNPQVGNTGPEAFENFSLTSTQITVSGVPEPCTITLMGLAVGCLWTMRRKRA